MSTRGESPGDCELNSKGRDLAADEGARSGDFEGPAAAALVRPERLELVRAAFRFVERLAVVGSWDELLTAEVDLIVVSIEALRELSIEERRGLLRRWRDTPDPMRVVIDVPLESRVALQIGAHVDLAAPPEIEPSELLARTWALVRRARLERDRNPLTGLPGNRWLRRQIQETLVENRAVGLLLLDIDDFKRYNDTYGHLRGDRAIQVVAEVLSATADPAAGVFVAHIGGDDFCLVGPPQALDELAAACLEGFAAEVANLGEGAELSITAAGTIVAPAEIDALEAVFARLARLKAEGKDRPGNHYVRD